MADELVDILLVGGGVASARCARSLRRRGFAGSILIVGEEPHGPYNRPPLTKELLRGEVALELVAAEPVAWYARHAVGLRTETPVARLDAGQRIAHLKDGARIRFDRCLIATGARPRRPPMQGAEHATLLRTLDDALALRERAVPGSRCAVIGGGFIGVEAAASLAARGVDVTILERANGLWGGTLGPDISSWARRALASAGVTVRTGVSVAAVDPDGARLGGERLQADIVLAGVGVMPRDQLAREAGIACDDGVVTDAAHRTGSDGIYAAGDVARVSGRRVEHWHAAREGGERAALAMLGQPLLEPRAPWVFSEFADHELDVVGWAPSWDEARPIGDPETDRFAVAYMLGGLVAQLAVVDGFIPVERARAFVEARSRASELGELIGP